MREPRPVLMKPREMKKASTINQITTSEKPLSASAMGRVPLTAVRAIPTMATAPMGSGLRMMPIMVVMKMARRCRPRSQSARRLASRAALAAISAAEGAAAAAAGCCAAGVGVSALGVTAAVFAGATVPLKLWADGTGASSGRPK